jgi:hypothetical protein
LERLHKEEGRKTAQSFFVVTIGGGLAHGEDCVRQSVRNDLRQETGVVAAKKTGLL